MYTLGSRVLRDVPASSSGAEIVTRLASGSTSVLSREFYLIYKKEKEIVDDE